MSEKIKVSKPGAIIIEGHVQGLSNVRSLGEEGIPVYVIDKSNCIARYSKFCKKFFICPEFKSDEFVDFLIRIAKEENLSGWMLVPSNDHAVYTIAKNKKHLESFFKIISPDLESIQRIYNKEKLLIAAKNAKIDFPITWFFDNYNEIKPQRLEYPLLVKGKFGLNFYKSLGKKAFLINNKNELKALLIELKKKILCAELFIQKLINYGNNKTISVAIIGVRGVVKTIWMGEKLREHPVRFGTATCSRSVYIRELEENSIKLVSELNFSGICEIEYLYDIETKSYNLIEINARTWLWVGLAKSCGVNFIKTMYEYLNEYNPVFPDKYIINKYWIHVITDLPFSIYGLFHKLFSLREFIKSYFSFPIFAVFRFNDIMPVFAELFILPIKILKRNRV